jgi:hypothetical protein
MQAIFCRDVSGAEPVNDFIDSLPLTHQGSIDHPISPLDRLRANNHTSSGSDPLQPPNPRKKSNI